MGSARDERGRRSRVEALVAAFTPGFLSGAHLAGLVFFVNPELPFSAANLGRGIAFYGGLGGVATVLLQALWIARRPWAVVRLLPWSLTVALTISALLDAAHASRFAYYLPPGINERLLKTALWMGLGAAICFYTALLHTLDRRPYGWRSRAALALLPLLSLYTMVERRSAFEPPRVQGSRRPTFAANPRPRLLVVGIEGASLDVILPLVSQGRLPAFESLLRGGAYGALESIRPNRRSALWTSLATGKYPWKHRVAGGAEYSAEFLCSGCRLTLLPRWLAFGRWGTLGAPALEVPQRRTALALWEIFDRLERTSGVVSWPAAAPFPTSTAFAVPEALFSGRDGHATIPSAAGELLVSLRPSAPAPRDRRRDRVARASLGDRWRVDALGALSEQEPDSAAVFLVLPGLTEASRQSFGGFVAVEFEGSSRPEDRREAAALGQEYARVDALLGSLLARDPSALVAVVSPYGTARVGWSERWRGVSSRAGSFESSPDGALLLKGPMIRAGALLTDARLVDLAPTVLYALGFPVAKDFDGRVVTAAFEADFLERRPLTFVSTYEVSARNER